MNIASPSAIRSLLEEFTLSPNKALGQNFIADDNILREIAEISGVTKQDTVLEIGPGLGALTVELSKRAKKVVAVEIDRALLPVLNYTLEGIENVKVIHSDILKLSRKDLLSELAGGFKVVANIPYFITTPLLSKLLLEGLKWESITMLVQLEAAQRLLAAPGTKQYGPLAIAADYFSAAKIARKVPETCFFPAPSVESAVIRLIAKEPDIKADDPALFLKLVNAAFAMRRKTLTNNMAASFGLLKTQAETILESIGINQNIRGEALTTGQFVLLSNKISQIIG